MAAVLPVTVFMAFVFFFLLLPLRLLTGARLFPGCCYGALRTGMGASATFVCLLCSIHATGLLYCSGGESSSAQCWGWQRWQQEMASRASCSGVLTAVNGASFDRGPLLAPPLRRDKHESDRTGPDGLERLLSVELAPGKPG